MKELLDNLAAWALPSIAFVCDAVGAHAPQCPGPDSDGLRVAVVVAAIIVLFLLLRVVPRLILLLARLLAGPVTIRGRRGHVIICVLSGWSHLRVWFYASTAWSWHADANAVLPLSRLARRRSILGHKTKQPLKALCYRRHYTDAVLLKQILWTPRDMLAFGERRQLSTSLRRDIINRRERSTAAARVMKRLVCIMGNAGYLPLVHSHTGANPNYIFHAKAIEETRHPDNATYPHKLFFKPATVMPDLQYGHTIAGEVAGVHDGTVAPDVVAFVMLHASPRRSHLGPRLFFVNSLEAILGADNVGKLEKQDFQIIPDKSAEDNRFGAIDSIELFGTGESGRRFMKFDYMRMEPSSRTTHVDRARSAIWALRTALDDKLNGTLTDMEPGDVLLVNNWRAATAWDEEASTHAVRRRDHNRQQHAHAGERIIFQMNFYLPRRECDEEDQLTDYDRDPAADRSDSEHH